MIILKEYNITADGKWLTIDVIANPSLDGVYLEKLHVSCTGDFKDASTFDALIEVAINEYTGEIINWEKHPTSIRVKLDVDSFNKPFYLFVKAADPEQVVTTCAHKDTLTAVTYNRYPLYQNIACSAKEFEGCEPPMHFIDYLMRFQALNASIAVGDAESINYYYDWLVLHGDTGYSCSEVVPNVKPLSSGCGCH